MISLDDLERFSRSTATNVDFNGDKFYGGFGDTKVFTPDYWELRKRSDQLFTENLYARGIIRRLVTNEINIGLSLEATPYEKILGLNEDSLVDWTDDVEDRFHLWGKYSKACDHKQLKTFGAIQELVRMESLAAGDVLVILNFSTNTKTPNIQLIPGGSIRTPLGYEPRKGHKIKHGVELDSKGRQVAFHVTTGFLESKRVPAFGERSGRRLSWMVYGTDRRIDAVRGQPMLALVLQSLKEIDRYRDAVQRKAVINSILAMFIKKTEDKMGTKPLSGGAVRKDTAEVTDGDGSSRTYDIQSQMPGLVMETLQQGEEPIGFNNQGTDQAFGEFERSIIQAVAWANQIPPEILTLSFNSNYSASQAAINEFKMYLDPTRKRFAEALCQPVYEEWLVNEVLAGRITAKGLLEAWKDPQQFYTVVAWVNADWMGAIKPSTDIKKQAQGQKLMVDEAWTTNTKVARELSNTNFRKNTTKLKRENEMKAEAMRPLLVLQAEFGEEAVNNLNEV